MSKFISYFKNRRNFVTLILVLAVIVLLVGTFFPANKEYVNQPITKNPETEIKVLVDKVSQLIYLPENEVPTIATVTDLEALKGQSFFVEAKVGDKVLIYTKAKKAVLYNPKSNKIVTIAPLSVGGKENPLQY